MPEAATELQNDTCATCGAPSFAGHTPECTQGEHEQSPEEQEEYRRLGQEVVDAGLKTVRENFDEHPKEGFEYHVSEHTNGVVERVEAILDALERGGMAISNKDRVLGRIAGAHHDTVQGWDPKDTWEPGSDDEKYGKVYRQRRVGKNESASADGAVEEMQSVNDREGREVFTKEDMDRVRDAISGTVPDFVNGRVVQKNLSGESDIVTRAVALADLGDAGIGGGEAHLRAGDRLFREEQLDMRGLTLKRFQKLPEEQQQYYQKRMMGWSRGQLNFVNGREAQLEADLDRLPKDAKDQVKELFSKFEDARRQTEAEVARREALSPDALFDEIFVEKVYEKRWKTSVAA